MSEQELKPVEGLTVNEGNATKHKLEVTGVPQDEPDNTTVGARVYKSHPYVVFGVTEEAREDTENPKHLRDIEYRVKFKNGDIGFSGRAGKTFPRAEGEHLERVLLQESLSVELLGTDGETWEELFKYVIE